MAGFQMSTEELYKRGILMEDDFVAGTSLQNPQPSISFNRLEISLEMKAAENRRFWTPAGICLGHRCAVFFRIFRFNNLEIWLVEP
jgi:hypothetical protein